MLSAHDKIEHQIKQIEESQDELRILLKKYMQATSAELRRFRLRKWQQMCLESYKKR